MKDTDIPPGFPIAFAKNAAGANITFPIPTAPQTGGRASLTDGFEAINSQPIQAGGIPPWGADFNGILRMTSAWAQWVEAGGPAFYDVTFSTAIGGYPKGAVLQSKTSIGRLYFNLADDNTNDPDSVTTNWLPFFANPCPPPVGTASNLVGAAAGGNKLASWTATELIAAESLGGRSWKGVTLTLSFNGATVGAGGMDTGAMPTASDLAIYAIYNPTTNAWATLGTVASVATAPAVYAGANRPSGYAASVLLWVGKTTGGNFVAFEQSARLVSIAQNQVLNNANSTGGTTVSIAAAVPAAAKKAAGIMQTNASGTGLIASSTAELGPQQMAASNSFNVPFDLVSCPGQLLFWRTVANPGFSVWIARYQF